MKFQLADWLLIPTSVSAFVFNAATVAVVAGLVKLTQGRNN